MALVEADFWKLRAQMLIDHREVVAELDLLYETLYGTPPPKPRKASVHRIGRGKARSEPARPRKPRRQR
jgi:hypothetical protein